MSEIVDIYSKFFQVYSSVYYCSWSCNGYNDFDVFIYQLSSVSPNESRIATHVCAATEKAKCVITREPFLVNGVWNRAVPPGKRSLLKAVAKWRGGQTVHTRRRLKVGADAHILQGCYINNTALQSLVPLSALGRANSSEQNRTHFIFVILTSFSSGIPLIEKEKRTHIWCGRVQMHQRPHRAHQLHLKQCSTESLKLCGIGQLRLEKGWIWQRFLKRC